MPATLDVLIGFSVVMLIFSLTATALIQTVLTITQLRGRNLLLGIRSLLLQIDPTLDRKIAGEISRAVLKHPLVARNWGQIGSIVQREELVHLLLGFAADAEPHRLDATARKALVELLRRRGIDKPEETLRNIRAAALQLERSHPDMAGHLRQAAAVIDEGRSEFVAGVNAWFDATMDRVSQVFTGHVRIVTVLTAFALAFGTQLDTIEVVNRLSLDKDLRSALIVQGATIVQNSSAADGASGAAANPELPKQIEALRSLAAANLISLPSLGGARGAPRSSPPAGSEPGNHLPGILISAVLIGLGAPFWFNTLKSLLSLRSSLAEKDDTQRGVRADQAGRAPARSLAGPASPGGEQGELPAVG